jgi:hypothetical protein
MLDEGRVNTDTINQLPPPAIDPLDQITQKVKEKFEDVKDEGVRGTYDDVFSDDAFVDTDEVKQKQGQTQTDGGRIPFNFDIEAIKFFYDSLFKIVATRAGKHWVLNQTELDMLTKPTKAVLDKHSIQFTPEVALVVSVVAVVGPRVAVNIAENIEKKAKQQEEAEGYYDEAPEPQSPDQTTENKEVKSNEPNQ